MIEAVIFDMDGLLIDTEPHWQEVERKVLKEAGLEITAEMQNETFGMRCDEQLEHWYKLYPWENPDLKAMADSYNQHMVSFFKTKASLMEGALEVLDFFKKKDLPIALASSSTMELIDAFLDRFALRSYFTKVVSAENEPYAKPHPGIYLETARQLNTSPMSCLALEDSFVGMIAAKAAKMKCIVVPDEAHRPDPRFGAADIKLYSLLDLTEGVFLRLNKS